MLMCNLLYNRINMKLISFFKIKEQESGFKKNTCDVKYNLKFYLISFR